MTATKIALAVVPSEEHFLIGHPESPARFQHFENLFDLPFQEDLVHIPSKSLEVETAKLVHTAEYLDYLKESSGGFLDYGDTYATPNSFESALEACGSTLSVVDYVLNNESAYGFALVRPPGHHASKQTPGGFCLINNIAVAARYAQSQNHRKVMIYDFDVHHGNGTQYIFEEDPSVLYISSHQEGIYPLTGYMEETGVGSGEGSIVNIPLPSRSGDKTLELISSRILKPLAQRHQPDLLLISAGFDGHWRDPLANLQFTMQGYHQLARDLAAIADEYCRGHLAFVLEGGYQPDSLYQSIAVTLYGLRGDSIPDWALETPTHPEVSNTSRIEMVEKLHQI